MPHDARSWRFDAASALNWEHLTCPMSETIRHVSSALHGGYSRLAFSRLIRPSPDFGCIQAFFYGLDEASLLDATWF